MGRKGSGVENRGTSLRITFTIDGEAFKETVKVDGQSLPPTPRNIAYAERLAAEIRDRIRHRTFLWADYFPDSERATTGSAETVGQRLDLWISLQVSKAPSTVKGYRIAVEWWKRHLGEKPLRALKHSDILVAIASEPTWTGKTRNNKTSVLRLALNLALRDGAIKTNPIDGLVAAEHQRPPPDPFSREEVEVILAGFMAKHGEQITNYFGFKFFSGLRTAESLALRWESVDFRRNEVAIVESIVMGEHRKATKTNTVRMVALNSRAMAYLKAQKAHSFLLPDGWVFPDPRTMKRWADDWTPREMYWRPMLKQLGIRYRSPYQCRHTYATMLLMAGVVPAFGARQLGHTVEMFLRTYAKWLDGGQNALEMGKLESFFDSDAAQGKYRGK